MYSPYFIVVFCYWKINRTVEIYDANNSRLAVFNSVDVKVSKTLQIVTVVWFFTLLFPAHIMLTLVRFVAKNLQIVLVFFLV